MSVRINSTAPDFTAQTTQGEISFHDWIGDSYAILFSHPKDFTPVCTTELGYMALIEGEFARRGTKIIGLSSDQLGNHEGWTADIEETQGARPDYPIIADADLAVAKLYDMLPEDEEADDARTAANNATVRTVFVIGPDKKVKLTLAYPMSTGRNFDEILRALDSIQLTERVSVATPVNWRPGDDVIIPPAIDDAAAKELFGEFTTIKPYLRTIPQPQG
ncbi:MAG: peroxiredoxin [Actinomycetales bacterium]